MTPVSSFAPPHTHSRDAATRSTRWLPAALLVLLALSALVRLLHLADNPGWDGDEGYNWSIAANLAAGHAQRFALRYTFVDHPPLFYLLGAALFKAWTHDLIALRTLSACCGVLATLGTFALGARIGGRRLGLLAAGIYALWPQAILQTRWAYTYNLVTPLALFALWAAFAP
jgi:4-amino-4-deoxy-L-arabinose transferase-like glycosyltransferase